jgi:hypothetical protein
MNLSRFSYLESDMVRRDFHLDEFTLTIANIQAYLCWQAAIR